MLVKKFEAKTMRDALELVKQHLGPEAIILSAKDNSRGFGLIGEKSVEVTAAVSDETLKRKRQAEARLNSTNRSRYESASARVQRRFIDKASRPEVETVGEPIREVIREPARDSSSSSIRTGTPTRPSARYVDILDEEHGATKNTANAVARQRVQDATQRARKAFEEVQEPVRKDQSTELEELKNQVSELKKIISEFHKMPQTFVSRHPGADEGIHYDLSGIFQKLTRAGLANDWVIALLRRAQETLPTSDLKRGPIVEAWIAKELLNHTKVVEKRSQGRFHLFVGPAGQGKTTSLVKFASHLSLIDGKRIGIVCADSRKVGAAEQMRIFAQILNVPFAVVDSSQGWAEVLQHWGSVECILVDLPGLSLKDANDLDRLKRVLPNAIGGQVTHYVQSVLASDEVVFEVADRYKTVGFDDVIFTGLDEAAHHGLIVNFQSRYNCPLHSFSTGPDIPEDFEAATKERVVDLIFKISKIKRDEN